MELIIAENCKFKENLEPIKHDIFNYLYNLIKECGNNKIEKIIIADNDFNNYKLTVEEMTKKVKQCSKISENGFGVVIAGTDKNNKYTQYIVVNCAIVIGFWNYVCGKIDEYIEEYALCYATLLHEIGHCIHYYILYSKYNYLGATKSKYDSYNKKDLEEYIYHQCITLTSEYYAQRFMNSIYKEKEWDNTKEILDIINNEDFSSRASNLNKIYRLIYFFILYISYYHANSLKPKIYEKIHNLSIRDSLKKIENELINFYNNFENPKNNFKNIINIFKEIYDIKYSSHDRI